jgi:predicted DCC family thiol-disulfide oxidoreductase YuxK
MISLANDYTDGKGRHAKGWLFFDAECGFCTRIARWLQNSLQRRGLDLAPLQDPRVGALLGMTREERLRELRFLDADGSVYGGSKALTALAQKIGWARPLVWLARIPGMNAALAAVYRSIAARRNCHAVDCSVAELSRR